MPNRKSLDELLEERAVVQRALDATTDPNRRQMYATGLERIDAAIARESPPAPTPAPAPAAVPKACPIDERRKATRPTPAAQPARQPQAEQRPPQPRQTTARPTPPAQPVRSDTETPQKVVWDIEPPAAQERPPSIRPAAAQRPAAVPTPSRQTTDRQATDNGPHHERQPEQPADNDEPIAFQVSEEAQELTIIIDGKAYTEQQATDLFRKWYKRWRKAEAAARRLCPASARKRMITARRNQAKYESAREALSAHMWFDESGTTVSITPKRYAS